MLWWMLLLGPAILVCLQIYLSFYNNITQFGWSLDGWCFSFTFLQVTAVFNYFWLYKKRFVE
jgi:hypothetical protein